MNRRRAAVLLAGCAASVCAGRTARAEGGATVIALRVERCGPRTIDGNLLRSLVRLELPAGAALLGPRDSSLPGALPVRVICSGDGRRADVRVGNGAPQTLPLSDLPRRQQARALALAIAERIRHDALDRVPRRSAPAAEGGAPASVSSTEPPPTAPAASTSPPAAPPPAPPPDPVAPPPTAPPLDTATGRPDEPPVVVPIVPPIKPPSAAETPRVPSTRERALGISSGVLGALTAGLFGAGVPVGVVGVNDPAAGVERGASAALLGTATATLVAGAITFGIYMYERRRAR